MGRGRPEPASRDKSSGKYTSDSKGCFIATAVYGDFNAPEVRRWRDQVLSNTIAGRTAITLYYRFSPPIARYLVHSPKLSAKLRKFLDAFVHRHG